MLQFYTQFTTGFLWFDLILASTSNEAESITED